MLHHWIIDLMKETPEQYAPQVSCAILKCTEACGLNRY